MKLLDKTTIVLSSPSICKAVESIGIEVPKETYTRFKADGRKSGSRTHYVLGGKIEISPKQLAPESKQHVDCECETCGKIVSIPYFKYQYAYDKPCDECRKTEKVATYRENKLSDDYLSNASETTSLVLNSAKICGYYENLGYEIPKETYQRYNRAGKNLGTRSRYILGATINVKTKDIPFGSHARINYICIKCGSVADTEFQLYVKRLSDLCQTCAKIENGKNNASYRKETNLYGKHYWKRKLIHENPNAKCDITGETDKRFLIVHHLIPRNLGGQEIEENVVVITSNMHQAFHNQYGHNVGIKEYEEFKHAERLRLNIG